MNIGERIRQRRLELGMSHDELARAAGYKWRSSINKIEKGGQRIPQLQIEKIAKALKVTPSYLAGWEEDDGLAKLTILQEETMEMFFELSEDNQKIVHDLVENLLRMQEGSDEK